MLEACAAEEELDVALCEALAESLVTGDMLCVMPDCPAAAFASEEEPPQEASAEKAIRTTGIVEAIDEWRNAHTPCLAVTRGEAWNVPRCCEATGLRDGRRDWHDG